MVSKKLEDWELIGIEPQFVRIRSMDGKEVKVILDGSRRCAEDFVAEIHIGGERAFVDRDALISVLQQPGYYPRGKASPPPSTLNLI